MRIENAMFPTMEQATSFFGGAENGPFVMANLLKFKEKAEYADGSNADAHQWLLKRQSGDII